jgi:aryl-alcohol dehydrogenase-like predicted oxidoreductase
MNYRLFGANGTQVSKVGFGAWAIGAEILGEFMTTRRRKWLVIT